MAAIKVFLLGDSYVEGDIFPKQVSSTLKSGNSGISFSYSGKRGASFFTYNKHPELLQDAISYQPNVLIVHLGTNDSYFANFDAKTFTTNVTTFYKAVNKALPSCKIVFVTPIKNKLKNNSINESTGKCADALVSFANSHTGCFSININKTNGMDFINKGFLASDNVHLSGQGYTYLGTLVGKALLNISDLWNGAAISQSGSGVETDSGTAAPVTTTSIVKTTITDDGTSTKITEADGTQYVIQYKAKTIKKKEGTENVPVHENLRLVQGRWWAMNVKGDKEDGLPWVMYIDSKKNISEYKCRTEYGEIVYIQTTVSNHFFGEAINVAYKDGADALIKKIMKYRNILDFMYKNGISAYRETWAKDGKVIDTVHFGTNTSKQAEFWNTVYSEYPELIDRYPAYFEWNIHNSADPRKSIYDENAPITFSGGNSDANTTGDAAGATGATAGSVNVSALKPGVFAGKSDNAKLQLCGVDTTCRSGTAYKNKYPGRIISFQIPTKNGSLPVEMNSAVKDDIIQIFQEIKEQTNFSVNATSTFRPNNSVTNGVSKHCYGIAIDINAGGGGNPWFSTHSMPQTEPAVGSKLGFGMKKCSYGGTYDPNKCIWSWNHPVVQIFKAHGWGWGGRYGDVMHFSPTGG